MCPADVRDARQLFQEICGGFRSGRPFGCLLRAALVGHSLGQECKNKIIKLDWEHEGSMTDCGATVRMTHAAREMRSAD